MHRLMLERPVIIKGSDFFGREAILDINPSKVAGWMLQYTKCGYSVPIDHKIAEYRKRRITLSYDEIKVHVYEHLGVLRYMGIDGMVIRPATAWLPYHGRPWEMWQVIKDACLEVNRKVSWCAVNKEIRYNHPAPGKGYTVIEPLENVNDPFLEASITINFSGLGSYARRYSVNHLTMERAMQVYTQGWPPWLKYLSRLVSYWPLSWPHHEHINWSNGQPAEIILPEFGLHRFVDLLGALSLTRWDRLLAGHVISVYGGHCTDLDFVRFIQPHLVDI